MNKLSVDTKTGVQYGYDGCYVTEYSDKKLLYLSIYIGSDEGKTERAGQAIDRINSVKSVYSIIETWATDSGKSVCLSFKNNRKGLKQRDSFRENELPVISSLCRSDICCYCGQRLNESSILAFTPSGVLPAHAGCFDAAVEAVDNWQPDDNKRYSFIGGLTGAVVGMILGAALWTLIGIAGYIASLAGIVMAYLISKGYDLLRGKPGKFKALLLAILVIIGVIVGTAGTNIAGAHNTYKDIESSLRPGEYITYRDMPIYSESEMVTALLKDMPSDPDVMKDMGLGLVFAALGTFGIIKAAGNHPDKPSKPRKLKGNVTL